jgi:hypothetical protein
MSGSAKGSICIQNEKAPARYAERWMRMKSSMLKVLVLQAARLSVVVILVVIAIAFVVVFIRRCDDIRDRI